LSPGAELAARACRTIIFYFLFTSYARAIMTMTTLDIQSILPAARHPLVFAVFESTVPGAKFVIVNNHDPVPLLRQLGHQFGGKVSWTYLEQGPEVWRVELARESAQAEGHAAGGCCGGCG
jgi:uncharacterized protein (DUF2249 family)